MKCQGPVRLCRVVSFLTVAITFEFSAPNRFTPGKLPKEEPLNQLVPLIEFSFDSQRGEKTLATR